MPAPGSVGDHAWVFDLVESDARRRHAALDRHRRLLDAALEGRARMNQVWAEAGAPAPIRPPSAAAAWERAQAAYETNWNQTVFGPIEAFLAAPGELTDGLAAQHAARTVGDAGADPDAYERLTPYALLFLQWEALHPAEWRAAGRAAWSPWTTKELVLARLARGGVPAGHRSAVADLVVLALRRDYRCKDWRYAAVARHVDGPVFRRRVGDHTDDAVAGPRARFLLYLLDHPGEPVTRTSWRRWERVR